MLFFTGDTHGDFTRFSASNLEVQKSMTKDDCVIICGDFGGIWNRSKETDYWLKWLTDKPFTLLFVDGNHENFDMLNEYPETLWHGGKVHKITESIFHLMRGQLFMIDGRRIFTFGGAQSHDISDGILEPTDKNFAAQQKRLTARNALFRVNRVSWWEEEMPSQTEYEEGIRTLEAQDRTVDYIVTHAGPNEIIDVLSRSQYTHDPLTDYLETIRQTTHFTRWFFGHYHDSVMIGNDFTLLYHVIVDAEGKAL